MLVDTHILLWTLEGRVGNMGPKTLALVKESFGDFMVSAASLVEIRLKQRKGGLKDTDISVLIDHLAASNITILDISANCAANIPAPEAIQHADPFDLLLIAHAIAEHTPLLTCDARILAADIPGLKLSDGRL